MENLVKDKPYYKGKGKLTESMRKKLTKAARCAIKMRSKEENRNLAIKKLQQDIHNSPLHCFGQHQACSPDYCKIAKSKLTSENTTADPSSDSSLIPDDIQSDLDVDDTISNIIDNEITFWQDATNNENECYHNHQ